MASKAKWPRAIALSGVFRAKLSLAVNTSSVRPPGKLVLLRAPGN